jgi:hypothetical protein
VAFAAFEPSGFLVSAELSASLVLFRFFEAWRSRRSDIAAASRVERTSV